jgi:uncharacterized protein YcaQ
MRTASLTALRRVAVGAQGYASRSRAGTRREVARTIARLSCIQLDSISTVERSHRIALGTRIGDHPRDAVSHLLRGGQIFEYWAHEACLLPIEHWPLFTAQMHEGGRRWYGEVEKSHPHLREQVLAEIRERGPLGSRHFEGAARQGEMWGWKPAKRVLELLWNHGELVVADRQGFQRLYDLPERVLPRSALDAPAPPEAERLRVLTLEAVRARGVLTEAGIVEHWRLRGGANRVRGAVDGLVADGLLERVAVEDGGAPVIVTAGIELDRPAPTAAVLLSPFDNLLWDRPFARRVLGFDHLIEVYKPAPQRQFGYYVLPFLRGDRIVGRVDLKSERATGVLQARAVHRETGVRASGAFDDALDAALDRLRRVVGLEDVHR